MNYPLIHEKALSRPETKRFRRPRREDVPDLPPGAVYVFRVAGDYRELPAGVFFDPSHDDVVNASAVSLVDLHTRIITVDMPVPSINPAGDFTLRATFSCQVTDAAEVARNGVADMTVPLGAYLRTDTALARIGVEHSVEEINVVRALATARLEAYTAIRPPEVAGITAEFLSVQVLTPADVAAHDRARLEEERRQELARLRTTHEDAEIQRMLALLAQGSDGVDALSISRDKIDLAELSARRHQAEQEAFAERTHRRALADERAHELEAARRQARNDLILTLLRQMGGSESYVDYHQVLSEVLADGAGPAVGGAAVQALGAGTAGPEGSGDGADGSRGAGGSGPAGRGPGDRDGRPQKDFITDEDGLLD